MYTFLWADMRCNGTSTAILSGSFMLVNFKEFLAWLKMCMAIALAINCVNPVCFNPFCKKLDVSPCLKVNDQRESLSTNPKQCKVIAEYQKAM